MSSFAYVTKRPTHVSEESRFGSVPTVTRVTYSPNRLFITWDYFAKQGESIDPLIELFRPVRDKMAEKHDLHIVILPNSRDKEHVDGTIERQYNFTCCPKTRKNVPGIRLIHEFDAVFPELEKRFLEIIDQWTRSPIGMKRFLKEKNKDSLKDFLTIYFAEEYPLI